MSIPATGSLRGLNFGAGTPYRFGKLPDVLSTSTIGVEDRANPYRPGITPGGDYPRSKSLPLELLIRGTTPAVAEQLATDLAAAFAPADEDEWLDLQLTGTPTAYAYRGRCRGVTIVPGRGMLSGQLVARCLFVATDPIRYGPEQSVSIDLSDIGDGFILPVVLPAIIDGTTGAGEAAVSNTGSVPADWTVTFTSPLGNPRLTLVETGEFVKVLVSLAGGETLTFNSADGVPMLAGVTPRPDMLAPGSTPFQLPVGPSTLQLTADTGTGTALVTWRPGAA